MIYDVEEAGNFVCPIMRIRKAPADIEGKMQEDDARHTVYGYCIGTECALFRYVEPMNDQNNSGYCGLGGSPFLSKMQG